MHFKSLSTFSKNLDVQNSTIANIVIVQEGLDKCGGFFTREFIDELITQGNSQPSGVKSRFGHPNMCKTTLGTFIGRYKNFRPIEEGGIYKAIADLTLAEIAKETQVEGLGISYFDYVTKMAIENPDMFGNSIVFSSGVEYPEMEIDGETGIVEKYLLPCSLIASDLVDSPAATSELFKSSDDLGVIMTNFLDENPQIFELVQKDDSILQNFLNRYENYKTKKSNMNLIDKLLGKSKAKDIEQTLGNGDIVTVITDANEAKVGDKVTDSDGKVLPNETYLLPDGSKWIIVDGLISEILAVEAPTQEVEGISEMKEMFTNFQKSLDERISKIEKSISENQKSVSANFEGIAKVVLEMKEAHTLLAKSVKSDYKAPKQEDKDVTPKTAKSFMDLVEEQKEAKQNDK